MKSLYESGLFVEDFTSFLAFGPAAVAARPSGPAPARFRRIVVEDLTFTYPAATSPALRGVSLHIDAGEVIALVGENGSGKTTLAKLLCRLYLPQHGTIGWDDTDTAAVDPDGLRRNVAVIFQDFLHYALTARENIGFGSVDLVDDAGTVRSAALRSGADQVATALAGSCFSADYSAGSTPSADGVRRPALSNARCPSGTSNAHTTQLGPNRSTHRTTSSMELTERYWG